MIIIATMNTEILKKYNLSVTGSRKSILELFLNTEGALAHADIESRTSSTLDRVTVYRTLQTFVEKGLIHLVPTTDNTLLYALCSSDCSTGHHHDDHVHFVCTICNTTSCIEEVTIPVVKLPRGFKPAKASMVIEGQCRNCK